MENNEVTYEVLDPNNIERNQISVTIAGTEWRKNLSDLGLNFDMSDEEIMNVILPIIQEEFNEDISDTYKIRKAINTQTIFVIPNSTAG